MRRGRRPFLYRAYAYGMESVGAEDRPVKSVDHRALAVALLDISSDVRRKSHEDTGVRPLSNGVLEILRVIESHPGITVAEVASRLGRQFSNVSVQLRELVAAGLVTRTRDAADKRYVVLHPTRGVAADQGPPRKRLGGRPGLRKFQAAARRARAISRQLFPALERLASLLAEPE